MDNLKKELIDIESLKKDLMEEYLGGFFVGGFGGPLTEMSQIEKAQSKELIKLAKMQGFDLNRYQKKNSGYDSTGIF